jgi:hypothetical protein
MSVATNLFGKYCHLDDVVRRQDLHEAEVESEQIFWSERYDSDRGVSLDDLKERGRHIIDLVVSKALQKSECGRSRGG